VATAAATTLVVSLPSQDDVVKKTEKITKRLQELFHAAQEGNRECFPSCAEKIHIAVSEMASLFPQTMMSSKMADTVLQLSSGAQALREQCQTASVTDSCNSQPQDYRLITQKVIQSAYDIAKAAKQLVMLSE
jgi:ubiquinone biosynthesis protein Coq4